MTLRRAPRALLLAAALLELTACSLGLVGAKGGIGNVPDDSVRLYLEPLTLIDESPCSVRSPVGTDARLCRALVGPLGGRLVGVYDSVTDTLLILLAIGEDGRQHVVWRPRSTPPGIQVEGVAL